MDIEMVVDGYYLDSYFCEVGICPRYICCNLSNYWVQADEEKILNSLSTDRRKYFYSITRS